MQDNPDAARILCYTNRSLDRLVPHARRAIHGEMADQMHECIKHGVSVLHIHARNELLRPTMRVDKFRETVRLIKERDPDAVIQISTGGRAPPVQFEGVEVGNWRMDPLNLMPEMASYTPGSVNLGPIVYQNDAKLTKDMAQRFTDTGIKPQVEVFDTNMITNAYNLVKAGAQPLRATRRAIRRATRRAIIRRGAIRRALLLCVIL